MVRMSDREARLVDSRHLTQMLIEVAEHAKSDLAEVVAPFDLPVPVARALLVLAEPTPMRELAAQLNWDPSYITGIADQLEDRGLVVRVPGKDRRIKLLEVTAGGRAIRDQVADALMRRAPTAQRLDDTERVQLAHLLERLLGRHPSADPAP